MSFMAIFFMTSAGADHTKENRKIRKLQKESFEMSKLIDKMICEKLGLE